MRATRAARALARCGLLAMGVMQVLGGVAAKAEPVTVTAQPFSQFRLGSAETRFGTLEFVGGLLLSADNALFGSLSSIRFLPDRSHFIAVLDTGHWMTGAIERDQAGRLKGLADVDISSMRDRLGRGEAQKYNMDSEGLSIKGDSLLVSFERKHRVDLYPLASFQQSGPSGSLPILVPLNVLRANGGLETVVTAPSGTPLDGATMVVAERSVDDKGDLYAAILDGPQQGLLSVATSDDFAVSDGVFLPSGDLLLLARRFNIATGVRFRILRFPGDLIRKGAVLKGEILFEGDMGDQIDNMEGIDAVAEADGSTRIILVSDDNHSLFQRSLMLEFRLSR